VHSNLQKKIFHHTYVNHPTVGVGDACVDSNRPEKRFAFKDARLPPKPAAGRNLEFKEGENVEVCYLSRCLVLMGKLCRLY